MKNQAIDTVIPVFGMLPSRAEGLQLKHVRPITATAGWRAG
jgi:hypothetical protein